MRNMLIKLGIADFREHLKDYLTKAAEHTDRIYLLGNEKDILLMSPQTLARLQERHETNTRAKEQYQALRLDSYLTLVDGEQTKSLPLDTVLGLCSLFGLATELTDILARPGAKENAAKWDISEYIANAIEGTPLKSHGRFCHVYHVITRLFQEQVFQDGVTISTLLGFFRHMEVILGTDDIQQVLQADDMIEEQAGYVADIIRKLSAWISELILYQNLHNNDGKYSQERIFFLFSQVKNWYEKYVRTIERG